MSKKKILIGVGVALLLFIMLAAAGGSTPKTVDQFIANYNREIKNTLGNESLVRTCSLNNVVTNFSAAKMQEMSNGNVAFMGTEHPESLSIGFSFSHSTSPDVVFPVMEAAILASGEDCNNVTTKLGILNGNRYNIPGGYQKDIQLNGKRYSLMSVEEFIMLSINIPK